MKCNLLLQKKTSEEIWCNFKKSSSKQQQKLLYKKNQIDSEKKKKKTKKEKYKPSKKLNASAFY